MICGGPRPSESAPATSRAIARAGFFRTLVCLLTLALPLAAQKPKPPAAETRRNVPELLRQASEALGREDFAGAVETLKAVVEIEPDMTEAWFNLGYAYSGLRQNQEAVEAYRKTLELQPDLFEARMNLGILFLEMQQPQAALAHLEQAVALKPKHARAHLYFGRGLSLAGHQDRAEQELREALQLEPASGIAHFDLGQLLLEKRQHAEALAAFQQAAELDPKLTQASLGIALALEGLGRFAEALTHFERYMAAAPGDLETRFHAAKLYLDQGKHEQAVENLLEVCKANPEMPGVAAALGDAFALAKNFAESEKFYRQAVTRTPQQADLHRALAQTLLDQQKFGEAEAEFRSALKLDPGNREALQGLATALYLQKRYADAIPLFENFTRAADAPPGLFFVLATCYDHLKDRVRALAAYERFLQLSTNRSPDQEWQARQRVKLLRRELRK